jgi:MYXO-CTERM domain-containing protein
MNVDTMNSRTPAARKVLLAALALVASLTVAAYAGAANKLWLAWDSSSTGCQQQTTDFFNCILDNSNFNTLALQYKYGEALTVGGTAAIGSGCGATDFQCVVNAGGFTPAPYDVVMHFYGTGWQGGTNGTATVVVGGKSVVINTAWVQTGDSCDGQTCSGAHEAYEAATDGVSADCCNGQYGHASCSQCQASCAKYDGNNGNPPYGCYSITCPDGKSYKMELLGAASNEFSAAGCTTLTLTNSCSALHASCTPEADGGSACCSGMTCQYFSMSGQPPYGTACCYGLGATCSTNTDCCGGSNCAGGKCACVPEGQWCLNADECCAGSTCDTTAHKCVTPPPPDAGSPADAGGGGHDAGAAQDSGAARDAGTASADAEVSPDASIGGGNGDTVGVSGPSGSSAGCSCSSVASTSATGDAAWLVLGALGAVLVWSRRRSELSAPLSRAAPGRARAFRRAPRRGHVAERAARVCSG